jgi:hypothetical protein
MDLTKTPADLIWCGAGAPVVQGILIGIGAAAIGLAAFPFAILPQRPTSGKFSGFARARTLVFWGRLLAVLLAFFIVLTVAGYIVLFVAADGRFCNARLTSHDQLAIVVWCCAAGVTLGIVILSGVLRWVTRRITSS